MTVQKDQTPQPQPIKPKTFKALLTLGGIDFCVIDTRTHEEVARSPMVPNALHLPLDTLRKGLDSGDWDFPDVPRPPSNRVMVVYGSDHSHSVKAALVVTNSKAFTRVLYLENGIETYLKMCGESGARKRLSYETDPNTLFVTSDQLQQRLEGGKGRTVLVDVRREDERRLFGSHPRSLHWSAEDLLHLVVADLPRLMADLPQQDKCALVLHCRSNKRAQYCHQMLDEYLPADTFESVAVLKEGVDGLSRLQEGVGSYPSFQEGSTPPQAIYHCKPPQ